jgi:anaerobic selenocysteine-containing dehydrogenase
MLAELAARYSPERTEAETFVPAAEVRRAVRMFATERPSCYSSWVGLEQHADAMQTNRAVSLFYALTGQFDSRGSNVLFPSIATHGVSDMLIGRGDPLRGKAALEALDFYVHVDIFENPSASHADVLLPACTCFEREALATSFMTAEDTFNWVQLRPAVVPPLHESRSELGIIFDLAMRLGAGEHFFAGDIEAGLNWQLAPSGLTVEMLRAHPQGVRGETRTRYRKYADTDPRTGQPCGFHTASGKVEVYSTRLAQAGHAPLPLITSRSGASHPPDAYPLVLTFFRLVQYCDEHHRNIPRLRRAVPEPFIEIHPSTAASADIADGEWVIVETALASVRLKARLASGLNPGVVATPYGWWQGCGELGLAGYNPFTSDGANTNLLIQNVGMDPISGAVPHRSQRCRVRKEAKMEGSAQ